MRTKSETDAVYGSLRRAYEDANHIDIAFPEEPDDPAFYRDFCGESGFALRRRHISDLIQAWASLDGISSHVTDDLAWYRAHRRMIGALAWLAKAEACLRWVDPATPHGVARLAALLYRQVLTRTLTVALANEIPLDLP